MAHAILAQTLLAEAETKNAWSWGLDDYFTSLQTETARITAVLSGLCAYPFFHPGLVSCRRPAVDQITRNVLNKFIGK